MKQAYYATRLAPDSHRAKTAEGYLICIGVPIARTGWQTYTGSEVGDDTVQRVEVYRSPEEVFSPTTMASFEGKTVTSPHPPVFLDPSNDASYYRGHVQNVRRGGRLPDGEEALIGDVLVKDVQVINQLENNHISAEISAGYQCFYVKMSDGRYAQTKILGNHVAIVPSGRAGSHVRILDSAEEVSLDPVVDVEKTVGVIEIVGNFLRSHGWLDPKQVKDAESEAVARNKKADEEANKLHNRTEDTEVMTEEEKKKAKDAEEEEKKRKESNDSLNEAVASGVGKAMDAFFEKFSPVMDKVATALDKRAKDKDDDKDDDDEEEVEDSELIPVETLSGKEIPTNPIPGADKKVIDALIALKPLAAKGTKDEKIAWNNAYRSAKGLPARDGDSYAALSNASRTRTKDSGEGDTHEDKQAQKRTRFIDTARQFHRKNANEVQIQEVK